MRKLFVVVSLAALTLLPWVGCAGGSSPESAPGGGDMQLNIDTSDAQIESSSNTTAN